MICTCTDTDTCGYSNRKQRLDPLWLDCIRTSLNLLRERSLRRREKQKVKKKKPPTRLRLFPDKPPFYIKARTSYYIPTSHSPHLFFQLSNSSDKSKQSPGFHIHRSSASFPSFLLVLALRLWNFMEDAPSGANNVYQKEILFKPGQGIAPVRPFYSTYLPLNNLAQLLANMLRMYVGIQAKFASTSYSYFLSWLYNLHPFLVFIKSRCWIIPISFIFLQVK